MPGSTAAFPRRSPRQIGDLPEVATVAETRNVVAEVDGSGSFMLGRRPRRRSGALADLEVKDGSLDDLAGAGTIAVYDQTAEDKGWSIGDTVPVVFPATGPQELRLVATFGEQNIGGTYLIGLPTAEANTQVQVDSSVYVKLAPGGVVRSGPHGDRDGHRRLSQRPGPEQGGVRRLDRRSGHVVAAVRDRPAPPGRRHRPDRHRQHAGAVDLRAHPRDRAAAGGGHDPHARCAPRSDGSR